MASFLSKRTTIWLLLGISLSAIAWWGLRAPDPYLDTATVEQLEAAAEELWAKHPAGGKLHHTNVPRSEWPPVVQWLDVQDLRITSEGVYLVLRRWFVSECGLFVLPAGSSFQPRWGNDPGYQRRKGRVFWYTIKG